MSWLSDLAGGVGDFLFGEEMVGPIQSGVSRPSVGGFLDGVNASDLLTGVGAVTGALSQPDVDVRPTGGLGAQDQRIQDFYLENYLPRAIEQLDAPFIGRPTRRAAIAGVDPEFDPIFGSYGLSDLQSYMDQVGAASQAPAAVTPTSPQLPTNTPVPIDTGQTALEAIGAPGFNEETNTYMTPFGQMIQGDAGRKAASDRALVEQAIALGSQGTNREQGMQKVATIMDAIGSRGDEFTNPYLGQEYSRDALAELLESSDLYGAQQMGNVGVYDPTPGFLGQISPILKTLGTGAVLGPIAGSITGAAGLSGLAGNIAQKGLTQLGRGLFDG